MASETKNNETIDRDPLSQPRLEPGRLYFVQLRERAGANLPARLCARFLHQQLHRAAGNSDLVVRQFTFQLCGAGDSPAGEITLADSSFHAEPLTVPTGTVIYVDFTQRSGSPSPLAVAAAR